MDELIDLLGEVSSGFQVRLQELPSLQQVGLAPYQARLLAAVSRRPGCSQQNLAGWTGRDKAQVARTIKELEARGLLVRAAHESDWRSRSLAVTATGERACSLIMRERSALGADVMLELTAEERRIIIGALRKMNDKLSAVDGAPGRR